MIYLNICRSLIRYPTCIHVSLLKTELPPPAPALCFCSIMQCEAGTLTRLVTEPEVWGHLSSNPPLRACLRVSHEVLLVLPAKSFLTLCSPFFPCCYLPNSGSSCLWNVRDPTWASCGGKIVVLQASDSIRSFSVQNLPVAFWSEQHGSSEILVKSPQIP